MVGLRCGRIINMKSTSAGRSDRRGLPYDYRGVWYIGMTQGVEHMITGMYS